MNTKLLYLENMVQTKCNAVIEEIINDGGNTILALNQTIFYPQGGGQPYDVGTIESTDGAMIFDVKEVRYKDNTVLHIGEFKKGTAENGAEVICLIDEERRKLNSRLHSAGHIVDMAIKELGLGWISNKGYHYPSGPYNEYEGKLDIEKVEEITKQIQEKIIEITARGIETRIEIDTSKLQNGKPLRTVYYGDFRMGCGGTHVLNLKEIGLVSIKKIKNEKGMIRVKYEIN